MLFECSKLGKKLQKSPKTRKKKEKNTCRKKREKKGKISVGKKVSNHVHENNTKLVIRILTLRILKNNGRELCKDGSAFRSRGR